MLDKKCKIEMFLKYQVKLKVLHVFNSIQFIDIIMLAYSQNEVN